MVESGSTQIRIVRNVMDADPATGVVWEGTLDLSANAGEVTISAESLGGFCTPVP